jgi:hypothetical protein
MLQMAALMIMQGAIDAMDLDVLLLEVKKLN